MKWQTCTWYRVVNDFARRHSAKGDALNCTFVIIFTGSATSIYWDVVSLYHGLYTTWSRANTHYKFLGSHGWKLVGSTTCSFIQRKISNNLIDPAIIVMTPLLLYPSNNIIDSLLPVISNDIPYLIILTCAVSISIGPEDILECPAYILWYKCIVQKNHTSSYHFYQWILGTALWAIVYNTKGFNDRLSFSLPRKFLSIVASNLSMIFQSFLASFSLIFQSFPASFSMIFSIIPG